jgi:ABC-type glycerol-3-phosphate transport system substrate-binding protein
VQSHATQPEVLSWTEGELAELFARGRLAMVLEQPWLLREVRQVPPPMMVGVAPMPRAPGGCDSVRTDCVVILDTASDVPACVDFLQYALSRERQQLQAALGVPSVRKDCAGDLPEDERWGAFRQALEHARGPQPESWSAIAALFERLLYLVASGRRSVDEAMAAVDVDLIGEPDAQRIGLPAPHPTEGVTPRERAGNR